MFLSKIDFSDIESFASYKNSDYIPVFLAIGNNGYYFKETANDILDNWKEAIQIVDYTIYKESKACRETVDKDLGAKHFKNNRPLFTNQPQNYRKNFIDYYDFVKFSPNLFSTVLKKNLDLNLKYMNAFFVQNSSHKVVLWLAKKSDLETSYNKVSKEIEKTKNAFKKAKGRVVRSGHLYRKHLDKELMNDIELLTHYIHEQYNESLLLGDIILTKEQDKLILTYLKNTIGRSKYERLEDIDPRLFAVGIIRFSTWYYNKEGQGGFWKYFEDVFGAKIDTGKQQQFKEYLSEILKKTNKLYLCPNNTKETLDIDDITMHSFVSNHCADGLFNNLFDFWRHDLERAYDTSDDVFDCSFEALFESIKNHVGSIPTHTANVMLCKETKAMAKTRIRHILRLMARCFWDNASLSKEATRVNVLFEHWKNDPNQAFQKALTVSQRKHEKAKEMVRFRTPSLYLKTEEDNPKVYFSFQFQRLPSCINDTLPEIKISNGTKCLVVTQETIRQHFLKDHVGYYLDEFKCPLPIDFWFSEVTLTISVNEKIIRKHIIEADNVRIFDNDHYLHDLRTTNLKNGIIFAISKNDIYPYCVNNKPIVETNNGLHFVEYDLNDEDIFYLNEDIQIIIGQTKNEGLIFAKPEKGIQVVNEDGASYPIFSKLPSLCIKAKKGVENALIRINNHNYNISNTAQKCHFYGNVEYDYYIIKLSDYITTDGFYKIDYSTNSSYTKKACDFFYLEKFSINFLNIPYFFTTKAVFLYDSNLPINIPKIENDLHTEIKHTQNTHIVSMDYGRLDSDCNSELIKDNEVKLKLTLNNKPYPLLIDIPALFWNFDGSDIWYSERPNDITLRECINGINKIYLKPSINLTDAYLHSPDALNIPELDNKIPLSKTEDGLYYFNLSLAKDWFKMKDGPQVGHLELCLPYYDKNYQFLSVICKGTVEDLILTNEHNSNVINGKAIITGDAENCFVTIFGPKGVLIQERVDLDENGCFSFEVPPEQVHQRFAFSFFTWIEPEEDDIFPEEIDIPLHTCALYRKVFDPNSLEGKTIQVHNFQDVRKRRKPHWFSSPVFLRNLTAVNPDSIISNDLVYGLYSDEHQEHMKDYQYYFCQLFIMDKLVVENALLIVTKPGDLDSFYFFAKDHGGYGSFIFDNSKCQFTDPNKQNILNPFGKRVFWETHDFIWDTDYFFHCTIKGD